MEETDQLAEKYFRWITRVTRSPRLFANDCLRSDMLSTSE
jgi:hypothetical protein